MDVVKGFVEGIVYKSEDTGYVVAKINRDNKECKQKIIVS